MTETFQRYQLVVSCFINVEMGRASGELASPAGIFRGARCGEGRNTSSPKNACVGGYW